MKTPVSPGALEKRKVSHWERLSLPYKLMVWPRVVAVTSWTARLVVDLTGLENRRFYRKWRGGKWERWWHDHPGDCYLWDRVEEWTNIGVVAGPRPAGLARGRPTLEEDGVRLYENRCGKCAIVAEVSATERGNILCTACDVMYDSISYNDMYQQVAKRPKVAEGRIVKGP